MLGRRAQIAKQGPSSSAMNFWVLAAALWLIAIVSVPAHLAAAGVRLGVVDRNTAAPCTKLHASCFAEGPLGAQDCQVKWARSILGMTCRLSAPRLPQLRQQS